MDDYSWVHDLEHVDLDELSNLYRVAPLGDKPPEALATVFGNSMFTCLVALSRDHKKIILYANPGTEGFYGKLGFLRMNTAMAIWHDRHAPSSTAC